MTMHDFLAWPGELEIRQVGGARHITGKFRYSETAVVADRGAQRKEVIMPNAFQLLRLTLNQSAALICWWAMTSASPLRPDKAVR